LDVKTTDDSSEINDHEFAFRIGVSPTSEINDHEGSSGIVSSMICSLFGEFMVGQLSCVPGKQKAKLPGRPFGAASSPVGQFIPNSPDLASWDT
jgi:hypothetical protein